MTAVWQSKQCIYCRKLQSTLSCALPSQTCLPHQSALARRIWRALKCNYAFVRRRRKTGKGNGSWRQAAVGRMEDRWASTYDDSPDEHRQSFTTDRPVGRPASSQGPQRRRRVSGLKKTGLEAASWAQLESSRLWSGRPEAIKARSKSQRSEADEALRSSAGGMRDYYAVIRDRWASLQRGPAVEPLNLSL